MKRWIETKISYEKTMENGIQKKVTESYLVGALSFTEAEARIVEEITPFITGEFSVSSVKKSNISELFVDESDIADKWYKTKLNFVTIDEKSGAEKRKALYCLVQTSDLHAAVKILDEGMKGTMADYEIVSIAETNILDVLNFKESETA